LIPHIAKGKEEAGDFEAKIVSSFAGDRSGSGAGSSMTVSSEARVAVIIPTYNRWPHVGDAIDSVLGQTYKRTECIVVDDASSDGSSWRIHEKYGHSVSVISNARNQEKSYCRNLGVKSCDAKFVCFLDSDDILTQNSVESRLEILFKDESVVSYGITQRFNQTEEEAVRHFRSRVNTELPLVEQYLAHQGFLTTNGFMISRDSMLMQGMYAEELTNMEDVDLFLRLLCSLDFKFCGAIVAKTRRLDRSAQTRLDKVIKQGFGLTGRIRMNPAVMERIGNGFEHIQFSEYEKFLGALYHARHYESYRRYYRQGLKRNLTPTNLKFFRRYLLSYLRIPSEEQ
jgi:glycosyltransferase involved in cell wall biosynthesis